MYGVVRYSLVVLSVCCAVGWSLSAVAAPSAPAINEPGPNSTAISPSDVHMELTGYADPDGDAHASTDFEIHRSGEAAPAWQALRVTGSAILHAHLPNGEFVNSHEGRTQLLDGTGYVFRARFIDATGQVGAWASRSFTTAAAARPVSLAVNDVLASPAPRWTNAATGAALRPAGGSLLTLRKANTDLLLQFRGVAGGAPTISNPAGTTRHAPTKITVTAGSSRLSLPVSKLTFTSDRGPVTIFLPQLGIAARQSRRFWVSDNGSTYAATAAQTTPVFTSLAQGTLEPWRALQAGFVVERFATGLRLPVNMAFLPNPGTGASAPFFYVTELHGDIRLVTRSGQVRTYASNLLNFPTGDTFQLGLTGIAVEPNTRDVFVTLVGNASNGNGTLTGRIMRLHSNDGGLTAASRTVVLELVAAPMSPSHQISNITIGPDGKLYVHVGDGFIANTASNLNDFRGKILRINQDGTAPSDNPFHSATDGITARDYIFAYGFRNPFGGQWRLSNGTHYEVENGPQINDRLAPILRGVNYGWTGSAGRQGDANALTTRAIYNWTPTHAPVNIEFVEAGRFGGSGFPAAKRGHAFVTEAGPDFALGPQARGKRIVEFDISATHQRLSGPTTLVEYRGVGRATAVGLAAGPDGLYFTDLYKDLNSSDATAAGAIIWRVRHTGG